MKYKILLLLVIVSITKVYTQQLEIQVSKISKNPAQLILEFYNSEDDFLKHPVIRKLYKASGKTANIEVNNIPPGNYALGIILDENNNGKLETNFLGIPKEPMGVSNYTEIKGPPKYAKALIAIKKNNNELIQIALNEPL